jgi:Domain of unknown function (DUF4157)/Microbial transglutaminase
MSQDQLVQQQRATEVEMPPPVDTATAAAPRERVQYKADGAIPPVGANFQAKGSDTDAAYDQTHAIAADGLSGAGGSLPHADAISQSFGDKHADTVAGISAHTDGKAAAANSALGAQGFASGNSVAFAGGSPDLHTAAHEAAHVVQQKGGVQLKGGVGQAGDAYEQNADQVADRVVQGKDASDLLEPFGGNAAGGAVQAKPVQFLGHELGKALPEGAAKPAFGEDHDQRRYSPEQYIAMWEEEQGKKMTGGQKATIDRGCIGLSANNIAGGGNPLDYAEVTFGDFERGHQYMTDKNKELHAMRADTTRAGEAPAGEYIMFAKMFWSNQSDGDNSKPDEDAFKADPATGKVDMTGYEYKAQPGYVNFDYGWWDDSSHSFWHANHMQYKDPAKRAKDPMKVYQSTKEHFIRGYKDFDRCVFGVALATNYDPGKAAMDHASRGGG